MNKIMIASLGLALLGGTATFAQNSSTTTTKKETKVKHKKDKKGDKVETSSTTKTSAK